MYEGRQLGPGGVFSYSARAGLHHKNLLVTGRGPLAEGRTQTPLQGFLSGVHFSSLGIEPGVLLMQRPSECEVQF